jgi:endonuclease I
MNISQYIFFIAVLSSALMAKGYPQPKTFSHASKIYKQIDFDYTRTAYTNERYKYDLTTCMDKNYVENDPKRSVIFVRIVSEERMLQTRKCAQEKICTNYFGKPYGGSLCCRKSDLVYKAFDSDILNIMPVAEDSLKKFKEPPLHYKGNIARVYLYINAQYGLALSYEEQMKYLRWHALDKVDVKECKIYKQVYKIQKRKNPWIEKGCKALQE